MNFSDQPPSKQWAALSYRGEDFAEVWFKPVGAPYGLTFRIPQVSFHIPGMAQLLTPENLLKALGITTEDVESWHDGSDSYTGEMSQPLPPPPSDVDSLNIFITMKQPQPVAPSDSKELDVSESQWQNLEIRWNAVLVIEVAIDTLRQRMESLRSELESALSKALAGDEKVHAPNADVAQWNKAKSRGRFAVPKVKEYIHRATWALATPERKKLEEFFKDSLRFQITDAQFKNVQDEVENLVKVRQVLSAHGMTVYQEAKNSAADIQGTLRTLQSNAQKKRVAARAKGNSF